MKKIILSILALMSVTSIYAQSQIFDVNGIYYRLIQDTISGNGGMIAQVTTIGDTEHYQGAVSIPSTVSLNGFEYNVGAINDMAFKNCDLLTSISIPASVMQIPAGIFYGCNNLTSITVASGNKYYDSRDNCNAVIERSTNTLIAGCKNTFTPTTVTSIGECAFYGCRDLISINLPYSITSIGKWAFLDCTSLLSAAIPENMTSIEPGVFQGCTSLTTVEIPSSITSIGQGAFYGCTNLTIQIPSSVTDFGEGAFVGIGTLYWNSNESPRNLLANNTVIPGSIIFGDDVTSIDYTGAFYNCGQLISLTIPSSVKSINPRAFEDIYSLKNLNWNTNVSLSRFDGNFLYYIGESLESIVIGDSVTDFDYYSLKNCRRLESIIVSPGNPVYDSRNNCNALIESVDAQWRFDYDNIGYREYREKIKNRLVLGCKNTTILEGIACIGENAFMGCEGLSEINIPSTVSEIDEFAFSGCSGLTSITIPSNVIKIEEGAFAYCSGLKTIQVSPSNPVYNSQDNCNAIISTNSNKLVTGCSNTVIPEGVTTIAGYAFSASKDLTSIVIPASVTYIGPLAFCLCENLTSLELPSSVNYIGDLAFAACYNLNQINIPSGVKQIGTATFQDCYNLTSLFLPSTVESIGNYAFSYCESLSSLNIPASVNYIGAGAFEFCTSLQSISIPEGVTEINDYTFYYCNRLANLSIPSTVDSIGQYVFYNCYELQSAGPVGGGYNYEFNWDTIPANAFSGLQSLRSVYIPKSVKAVYECYDQNSRNTGFSGAVFYKCDSLMEVAVSFNDTKLYRSYRNQTEPSLTEYWEYPMDYNLYKFNPIKHLTILDDTIHSLSSVLMDGITEIELSESVNAIDSAAFSFEPYSETIVYYPNSYYYYSEPPTRTFYLRSNIEYIAVDNGNAHYSSVNGVLLNNDGTQLIMCPTAYKGGYSIPTSVTEIAQLAFRNCAELNYVMIPYSVALIGERAFEHCYALDSITIQGSPRIEKYAFWGCNRIRSVSTHSVVPGLMDLYDTPPTIITGDYSCLDKSGSLSYRTFFNQVLGRYVTEIKSSEGITTWSCNINTQDIPAGRYKIALGILPNTDSLSNRISLRVEALATDGTTITLYTGKKGSTTISFYVGTSEYDTLFISSGSGHSPTVFEFPQNDKVTVKIQLVRATNVSNKLVLDRLYFIPDDNTDTPSQCFTGPFTEKVFNNATLYVPSSAVSAYQTADGWRLFDNIAIDTYVDPIRNSDNNNAGTGIGVIYDFMGRKVEPQSLDELAPGLYIMEGKTYIKM